MKSLPKNDRSGMVSTRGIPAQAAPGGRTFIAPRHRSWPTRSTSGIIARNGGGLQMIQNGFRLFLTGRNRIASWSGQMSFRAKALEGWAGLQRTCIVGADQFSDPVQPSGAFSIPGRYLVGDSTAGGRESRYCGVRPETAAGMAKQASLGRAACGSMRLRREYFVKVRPIR